MNLDNMLKGDATWLSNFAQVPVKDRCDGGCGKSATKWFGTTNQATCGKKTCIHIVETKMADSNDQPR